MSKQKQSLWEHFKSEFRLENLSLNFERNIQFQQNEPEKILEYFHSIFWPNCNKFLYLIYRISIALYYSIWLIESIVRNAEYRRTKFKISTSINILQKEKVNIFLIHPWPFYMTSWSLAVLFFHLWTSAFICLYFYTINNKSWLTSVFSYLFGPFSCSRSLDNNNKSNSFVNCSFRSANNKRTFESNTTTINNNNTDEQVAIQLDVQTDVETTQTTLDQPHQVEENSFKNIYTYCDNQAKCNIPSASVISNATAWKLWIDSHVPNGILILIKISWLLNNIVVISAIVVSLVYLSYIYFANFPLEPSWASELGNWHRHGINSIVAIVDLILLGYPIRVLHFVYVNAYGWLYALVTFIYFVFDPKENIIYEQIDYNQPAQILIAYFFLTVLVFFMQVLHFLAYRLKVTIRDKYLLSKST